ncbi:hypothetical protein HII31_02474 [Pseudocercospora fuligena]|uniref:Uncharacterized protein n=1 Tax=Pseudocercospora fuligena TaxID=685502 RepID=A0A8H6RSF3_9PEZI|nr:hypothetical protein HII31_02474 [Pseudocercospora fuligena]
MSTLFGFDVKSPPRYRTDDQTTLNHYEFVWKCWLQFRRDLQGDYDSRTITWVVVMEDAIFTSGLAPPEKSDACSALRFVRKIHENRPERAIAIVQDLRQRASRHFEFPRFYLQCGDHKFSEMPHMLDAYRIVNKHICDSSWEQEGVVAKDEEKRWRRRLLQESDRVIFLLVVVVAALLFAEIFSRDLKEDYPDENKVGWFTIMQSASDFKDYSHGAQLSTDKHDQFKTPRLRFGCVVQYPVATQAIGIMKDLSERAVKHFDVETLLYHAPGVLAPEVLDTLASSMRDELQNTVAKEEKQAVIADNVVNTAQIGPLTKNEAKVADNIATMIDIGFLGIMAVLTLLAYGLVIFGPKFGIELKTHTILGAVLFLLITALLVYRQALWSTVRRGH